MTPRTFAPPLARGGDVLQELLEDVRHMLAVEHLKGGRLSIEEIAYTLGYSDLANFRRAFKRLGIDGAIRVSRSACQDLKDIDRGGIECDDRVNGKTAVSPALRRESCLR